MEKILLTLALCMTLTLGHAQKVYHLVTFEIVSQKIDTTKNVNTLIYTIPVDYEYYNCTVVGQTITNYFPCRNINLLGMVGSPDWKIVIRKKETTYQNE